MSYQVIAPCVLAKDQNGLIRHKYEGQLIPWLSDEQAEHFLAGEEPLVVKVGAGDEAPLRAAPKAEWVDYAISKGADPVEAEATNKPDLIELYGG